LSLALCAVLVFSLAFAFYTPSPAFAASSPTQLISHSTAGDTNAANGESSQSSISEDGTKIVFTSKATNLTGTSPGNTKSQIYLYDSTTNTTELISHDAVNPNDGANGDSSEPQITPDGTKIVFISNAINLISDYVGRNIYQVYLYDIATDTTKLISHEYGSPPDGANDGSYCPQISSDGSKIVFQSDATNLVSPYNGYNLQIYLYDTTTENIKLISHANESPNDGSDGDAHDAQISSDGTKIAYSSRATNLTGNLARDFQIYLYDSTTDTTKLISHEDGVPTFRANGQSVQPHITLDGTKIVYCSDATNVTKLTGTLTAILFQIYLYDVATDTTKLISHADGTPTIGANRDSYVPKITPDGVRIVYFSLATDLTNPFAAGTKEQIYLYNTAADTTLPISRADGTPAVGANKGSYEPQITPDGTKVVYESEATNLISGFERGTGVQVYLRTLSAAAAPSTSVNIKAGELFRDKELTFSYSVPSDVFNTYYCVEGTGSLVPNAVSSAPGAKIEIGTSSKWPDGNYTLKYFSMDNDGNIEAVKSVSFAIGTKVSSIKASQSTIYVAKGKTVKLPYIVNATASVKVPVTWKASKKAVASVSSTKKSSGSLAPTANKNQSLTIKAGKKLGTSKITLTSGTQKLTLSIKVVKRAKAVAKSSVKIKSLPAKNTLRVGASKTIKPSFTKAATAIVTWKSSKTSVVKVDASGKLTALKKGTATITLKVGGKSKSAKITVK
jgi:Tol biopolymer transport system component